MIMSPGTGTLNRIATWLHLPTSQWINGSDSALYSVLMVDVWKTFGFYVVLLTAAMLAVRVDLEDAAKVDGAGRWRVFIHVTLPSIAPTLALVSILIILHGLQAYVVPTVLGPGPGDSTLMMTEFIISDAFRAFNLGGAAAAATVLGALLVVVTLVQLRLGRSRS
jgi:ABC-type sugar transport system permease subunit